ncbi:MAG: type I restriction enzyme HsdR N-terminal domain-containing protein [Flavobacteriaceae bacterium]|nr:type I restriction enzyme HsdR N-terminal domain-containing protein [Flavobacteriaceae bacterium]
MDSNSVIELPELNFPEKYHFRLRKTDHYLQIFCPVRKKWFQNTAEEWVRQHSIQFLHKEFQYPLSSIVAEFPVQINYLHQRADIIVLKQEKPWILTECKKPEIPINQTILDQAMRYAQQIGCTFIFLTNGIQHIYCHLDHENKKISFIEKLPSYQ